MMGYSGIDMRQYKDAAFNMSISMLTEEGLPSLLVGTKSLDNRQISIFPECNPMIAIAVGTAPITGKLPE